jgi:hypothetical protein
MHVQYIQTALIVNTAGMYIMLFHLVLEDDLSHNTVC